MGKFKIGDVVMIRETSEFYDHGPLNPPHLSGTVVRADGGDWDFPIDVEWEGRGINNYNTRDLVLEKPYKLILRLKNRKHMKKRVQGRTW